MFVDDEGYVLIQTFDNTEDGTMYDVFGPTLDFVNRVVLPELPFSSVVAHGCVYRIERSDDRLPWVARYRLESAEVARP